MTSSYSIWDITENRESSWCQLCRLTTTSGTTRNDETGNNDNYPFSVIWLHTKSNIYWKKKVLFFSLSDQNWHIIFKPAKYLSQYLSYILVKREVITVVAHEIFQLFTQQLLRANTRENIIVPTDRPFRGIHQSPMDSPSQMASKAESVSVPE